MKTKRYEAVEIIDAKEGKYLRLESRHNEDDTTEHSRLDILIPPGIVEKFGSKPSGSPAQKEK